MVVMFGCMLSVMKFPANFLRYTCRICNFILCLFMLFIMFMEFWGFADLIML